MTKYVVYTRVSTQEQGKSGLGLEAQNRDIELFLTTFSPTPYEVVGVFCDVLSGGADDRPELEQALHLARSTGAELLISKLDRLSRRVSLIARLMDDPKLKIRVAQMPSADKFQLHIYAALAEQERTFISERTKSALKAAKARGVKLGGLRDATMARNVVIAANADARANKAILIIGPLRTAGQTLDQIAKTMNTMSFPTARGGTWSAKAVSRVIDRTASMHG